MKLLMISATFPLLLLLGACCTAEGSTQKKRAALPEVTAELLDSVGFEAPNRHQQTSARSLKNTSLAFASYRVPVIACQSLRVRAKSRRGPNI